jgi:hypothetical protein
LTIYQAYAALRIGLKKHRDPREQIGLISQFFDALEREFLNAYPDEMPVFKDGVEKEIERLIRLKVDLS